MASGPQEKYFWHAQSGTDVVTAWKLEFKLSIRSGYNYVRGCSCASITQYKLRVSALQDIRLRFFTTRVDSPPA